MLVSGDTVDIRPGNALPVRSIPLGTVIHNVETQPGIGYPTQELISALRNH